MKPRLIVLACQWQHPCSGPLADLHTIGSSGTWTEIAVKHHDRPVEGAFGCRGRLAMKSIALALIFGASGHVSLYGIQFDTDSAAIKPDSEPTLAEIAKLLKEQ